MGSLIVVGVLLAYGMLDDGVLICAGSLLAMSSENISLRSIIKFTIATLVTLCLFSIS